MNEDKQCPYLIYKVSKSCVNCTGYRCTSAGREKKVDESQLETCRNEDEYINCVRYIAAKPPPTTPVPEIAGGMENLTVVIEPLSTTPDTEIAGDIENLTVVIEPQPTTPDQETATQPTGIGGVLREKTATAAPPPPAKTGAPCGCGHPDVRQSDCPYQGPPPEGEKSCLGLWCYGNNRNIRVDKNCVNWKICTVFLMSKYMGVPYYDDQ